MREFRITSYSNHPKSYYVEDHNKNYIHSDGRILSTREYWPTEEQAQAVLDKYRPKHVWKHGDVFTNCGGATWLYSIKGDIPDVICISGSDGDGTLEIQMDESVGIKFLFNIKAKLSDTDE